MDTSKPTISVGIPAFNEYHTIRPLLTALLKQIQDKIFLKEIIVVSDASIDGTEEKVRSLGSPLVKLMRNEKRQGAAQTINTIDSYATGDILVLLNADILITDNRLLEKLVKPIVEKKADMVAGNIQNMPPKAFVDLVLAKSCEIKKQVYSKINNGINVYTCHGPIRALRKELYKSINLIDEIADDMYTYYYAKMHKYRYAYVPEAVVYYKLPTSIREHIRQSNRFFASLNNVQEEFKKNMIDSSVYEPGMFTHFMIAFIRAYPFYSMMYIFIQAVAFIRSVLLREKFHQQWEQISSSKFFYGL